MRKREIKRKLYTSHHEFAVSVLDVIKDMDNEKTVEWRSSFDFYGRTSKIMAIFIYRYLEKWYYIDKYV